MADPNEFDHVMPEPPRADPKVPARIEEGWGPRIITMVLLWVALSLAQSLLSLMTVIQLVLTLVNGGRPNHRLADFGIDLGTWIAKSARYQCMASEEKPWPWTAWE